MVRLGPISIVRTACALACGFGATAVQAQSTSFWTPPEMLKPPPGWLVTFGGQFQVGPEYPGAKQFGPGGSPWFSFRRAQDADVFQAPDDSFNLTLWGNDRFRFGPSFGLNGGRYVSDDHQLDGIHHVSWGFETGLFAEIWPIADRFRMHAEVRYGFGYKGVVADLGADWVQRIGRFTLSAGPRAKIGDGQYLKAFFGVTPADALGNAAVTPFSPGGGLASLGVLGGLTYAWNEHWTSSVFLRYDRLVLNTARSPIVKAFGTTDQFMTGVSLRYSFYTGDR